MTNPSDEASTLRLVAFGSPRLDITTSGITHSIGPGKPLALVTFLAFAPRRTATRETLCDILWGDRPVELCRPALRQTLWLAKTQIDSSLLSATADGVSLARDVSSDVEQFVAAIEANDLECAVDLYAGNFFSGYAAPGARRFEEWASLERTRLQALFVQAAEALARRAIDSGRFGDAVQLARRLRSADTNGQVGWRLLLEARIASGDLIDARADADHFEEWLRQEEWDPEPASRSLLKLAREASTANHPDIESDVLISELVGREREFAAINDAWSEAQTRGARIVHIVAESGHGKTRLTRDVLARIRVSRGAVHYIKANYGEREIPYSFAAAIAEAIASSPGAGGVAPAAANTLVSLNPALSASYSQSSRIPEQLEPLRVGLALLDLFTAVAEEEPLAIALDDLHWCDPHSREALTIVVSRIKSVKVLVIATARPQYIVASTGYERLEIRLPRLEQDDVTSLITSIARLPEEPWALKLPVVLGQSSGGSPFQILETLHFCLDTGLLSRADEEWQCNDIPALMLALEQHGSIDRRMATLSAAENAVLLALGIAGMPTKRSIVVKATELTGQVADEAAANLEVRGMLVADEDWWSLAHDAIAEAVLSNAETAVQEAMHARLGAAMARDEDSSSRRRAIPHLAEANDWKRVADSAAPFVRNRASTSSEVDVELGRLLGTSASNSAVARVRDELPLTVRQPRLMRRVLRIGAVLSGAVLVYLAIARTMTEKGPATTLMAISTDANGGFRARSAVLDRDRWEASSPLVFDAPQAGAGRSIPSSPHAVQRPGSTSWAINSAYPDSGQGEIDLVDGSGERIRLTNAKGDDRPQSFSPDGRQLLFLTTRWTSNGWSDLAVMDVETLRVKRLTHGKATHADAFWSADGTRIAFLRNRFAEEGRDLCLMDADGGNKRCGDIAGRRLRGQAGWLDAHHLLIAADSGTVKNEWLAYDIDDRTARKATFPSQHAVVLDQSGKWALSWEPSRERVTSRVSPSDRYDLARPVPVDASPYSELRFASDNNGRAYVDSMSIVVGATPLATGVSHQLSVRAWTVSRAALPVSNIRWRSLNPAVANIDSLGILTAEVAGEAVIEASAGGWRVARDTLRFRPRPVTTVLREEWNPQSFKRWRTFGEPLPAIVETSNGKALLNRGDGSYLSGAYFSQDFDATMGLALDLEVSTPVTRTQWQLIVAGFDRVRNEKALERWDHRSGYIAPFLNGSASCWFSYPDGEGEAAVTSSDWFPALREVMADSVYRLDTGQWYTVRIQVFPDGRCGLGINGHALTINPALSSARVRLRPVIQGNSVGASILVGKVTVRTGVPGDVDWSSLRFETNHWVPAPPASRRR